ncbi:tRNA uridine-5-carboxymethylaminomethyl(34) synthesis GTPase MnmE [Selenomonas sputigena]|uniref:tRNA modification GTPase MnmE n=1 Tax=Selenomonas sputigena TaxID=69823 RepID=A0ABV3X7E4_9FIRM
MPIGETISAIATAAGEGGIGIVRLSGTGAIRTASRMFRAASGKSLEEAGKRGFFYGNIVREDGRTVDEAICLVMRSPHSYTKEDVVELQCHGGMMPLRETLALTYRHGARPAERGEFTKRAFLNGRLDLVEAQAVMNIVKARTEAALEMAAGHLAGHLSSRIQSMRGDLLALIAHLEALIDFPEEGVEDVVMEDVRERIKKVQEAISAMIGTAHTGRILSDGLETAIVGKPNVGKSSLLNALLREERAIVTDIPGTTRDSIEEYVNIGGVPLRIIDTAGIRATDDAVERIGVEKARTYVENAALILALFDGSLPLEAEDEDILCLLEGKEAFLLVTKSDLPRRLDLEGLRERFPGRLVLEITTKEETGLAPLRDALVRHVYGGSDTKVSENFIDDLRTKDILEKVEACLLEALHSLESGMGVDFISIDLRVAWEKLGEITGDTINDDIMNEIFSRFCVGK